MGKSKGELKVYESLESIARDLVEVSAELESAAVDEYRCVNELESARKVTRGFRDRVRDLRAAMLHEMNKLAPGTTPPPPQTFED